MSGVNFLIDTLLATRLAQRADLVPLKGALDISAPGPVTAAEEVSNDPRLISRAGAMQLQGGAESPRGHHFTDGAHGTGLVKLQESAQLARGLAAYADPPARTDAAVTLSMTARTLSEIMDSAGGAAPEVRGTAPLWPQGLDESQTSALAATLARTVVDSGLFYESHLRQLAAGTRTRSQLAQEPQARLGERAASEETWPVPAQALADAGQEDATGAREAPRPAPLAPDVAPPDAGRQGAAGVHLDAMTLVRQQLELLAVPTFRWSGEAWPGAPMTWDIHEEQAQEPPPRSEAGADAQEVPRTWTTRLVLDLPELRQVEVRLSLTGSKLQVHLAACETQTLALLGEQRAGLSARLGEVGLQVGAVQVQAWPQASDAGR